MPRTKISEFSATPASNTDIDSIFIGEGMAPSNVNDAIRELMAQLKDWQSGTSNDPYVVGSSGSLTLNQGTANTVPYLNGSKVVTSGTALSFDGTNLGVGAAPSAWGSGYRAIDLGAGSSLWAQNTGSPSTFLSANVYYNGTNFIYKTSTYSSYYLQNSGNGQHQWYTAASGTAGNAITFTQAMTLDASGNLGVGATSPNSSSFAKAITLNGSTSAGYEVNIAGTNIGYLGGDSGQLYLRTSGANPLTFATNGTERARIDSSGNLLVGTTSGVPNGGFNLQPNGFGTGCSVVDIGHINNTSSGTPFQRYVYNNGVVGSITQNGTTGTLYNTSSDYRLKNITGSLTGYKERLMSLKPKQGTWISDGSEFRGFLAHDFAVPYRASVTGEKDAVDTEGNPIMQSMQASSSEVMADLVALVQEQQAIIESLKARLDAANL